MELARRPLWLDLREPWAGVPGSGCLRIQALVGGGRGLVLAAVGEAMEEVSAREA